MSSMRAVRVAVISGAMACCASVPAMAADRFFLYNLTTSTTFTGVYLAPAGTLRWGTNQTLNDKDKEVDPSERLAIKDIGHGRFDVRVVDQKGRSCIRRDVDLSKDVTFDIRDSDLTDCR